jgi:hypothetical protein
MLPIEGQLSPAYVAVPASDEQILDAKPMAHGLPGDAWFARSMAYAATSSSLARWRVLQSVLPITEYQSAFLYCVDMPSFLVFGALRGAQHRVVFVDPRTRSPRSVPGAPPFAPAGANNFSWACFTVPLEEFRTLSRGSSRERVGTGRGGAKTGPYDAVERKT